MDMRQDGEIKGNIIPAQSLERLNISLDPFNSERPSLVFTAIIDDDEMMYCRRCLTSCLPGELQLDKLVADTYGEIRSSSAELTRSAQETDREWRDRLQHWAQGFQDGCFVSRYGTPTVVEIKAKATGVDDPTKAPGRRGFFYEGGAHTMINRNILTGSRTRSDPKIAKISAIKASTDQASSAGSAQGSQSGVATETQYTGVIVHWCDLAS